MTYAPCVESRPSDVGIRVSFCVFVSVVFAPFQATPYYHRVSDADNDLWARQGSCATMADIEQRVPDAAATTPTEEVPPSALWTLEY